MALVDLDTNIVSIRGHRVELSPREAEVLHVLEQADDIMSGLEIAQRVYAPSDLSTRSVWIFLHHLRRKLARTALRVERVSGYRLRWVH